MEKMEKNNDRKIKWKKIELYVSVVLLLFVICISGESIMLAKGILQVQLKPEETIVVNQPVTKEMFQYMLDDTVLQEQEQIIISPDCFSESGEQELFVEYYMGETVYYSTIRVMVESLKPKGLAADTDTFSVVEGQEIKREQIPTVYVLWNNGIKEEINDYTYEADWEQKKLWIYAHELAYCFSLEIVPNQIKDMQVTCKYKEVTKEHRFVKDDLSLLVYYTNGTSAWVEDFIILPYVLQEGNDTCISVQYQGEIADCKVTVIEKQNGNQEETGTNAETGKQEETGTNAETGKQEEAGTNAETGKQEETGTNVETGKQEETGTNAETGKQEETGTNAETGKQEEAGTNQETGKKEDVTAEEDIKQENSLFLSGNLSFQEKDLENKIYYYREPVFIEKDSNVPCYYQVVRENEPLTEMWILMDGIWKVQECSSPSRVYIKYQNKNGEEKIIKSNIFCVDTKKPVTNVISKTYGNNVKITADDLESGIDKIQLSGAISKEVKSGYVLKKEGTYRLKITDVAGNVKKVKFTIKKTAKHVKVTYTNTRQWNKIKFCAKVTGTSRKVSWSIKNKKAGTLSKNGTFLAKASGVCYVTAKIDGITVTKKIVIFKEEKLVFIF